MKSDFVLPRPLSPVALRDPGHMICDDISMICDDISMICDDTSMICDDISRHKKGRLTCR